MSARRHHARVQHANEISMRAPTYQSICASLSLSAWPYYLTTRDDAIGPDPGVALAGGALDTWTDQRSNKVWAAQSALRRLVYAPDGAHFGGRSVVQNAITDARYLQCDYANFFETGDKPWLFVVARARGAPVGVDHLVELSQGATDRAYYLFWYNVDSSFRAGNGSSFMPQAASSFDQSVHIWSVGTTPAGGKFGLTPGALVTTGNTGGITGPITRITIGANRNLASGSNASIADLLMFRGYPGAAIEAQLTTAAQAKWQM